MYIYIYVYVYIVYMYIYIYIYTYSRLNSAMDFSGVQPPLSGLWLATTYFCRGVQPTQRRVAESPWDFSANSASRRSPVGLVGLSFAEMR